MAINYEYLKQLFISCLEADYVDTVEDGSFAAVRDGDLLYLFFEIVLNFRKVSIFAP